MENKKENNIKKLCIILIAIMTVFFIFIMIIVATGKDFNGIILKKGLDIKSIAGISYSNDKMYVNIKTYDLIFDKELWCIATDSEKKPDFNDNWEKVKNNECKVNVESSDKYIYVRDSKNIGDKIDISDYISRVVKIEINDQVNNEIKIIKNEEVKLDITLKTIGDPDKTLEYQSEDEDIVKIEDGVIIGINDGKTKIRISDRYGNTEVIDVQVTSLISMPTINNSKPFLKYKQYTEEEAKILDDYLFYQIDKAGYGTRAGVVAAARFLSLEFEYRIPYFVENGRLTHFNHQRPYCDGEGRYFHRGLYLSEDKYDDLEKSVAGPMMWGGYIREWSEDNGIIRNGLDCSGFVCWCLINGGFDTTGDIGGGLSEGLPTLSDYGVSQKITMELLESGKVKAGDLIGLDGHIGIIIGVDDECISVADTLYHSKGLLATRFTFEELVYKSDWTHIYDYTEVYEGKEGNYTNMW